jgi:tRNA(fMet)-specific endonuclease VapC
MPYLIDSNWVIRQLNGNAEAVKLLEALAEDGIGVSIITYMEAYQGVLQKPDPKQAEAEFEAFFRSLLVLPLSPAVARRCARLREDLKRAGKQVRARALDLVIAATALEHDLTLVTQNTDDFKDIPGLKIYRK